MAQDTGDGAGGPVPRALVPRPGPLVRSTRADDLALLPAGSVVVDADGDCAQAAPSGCWWWMGSEDPVTLEQLVREAVWPVSVVWVPTRPEHLDPAYWTGAVSAVPAAGGGTGERTRHASGGASVAPPVGRWRRWWVAAIVVPACLLVGLAAGLGLSALLT